MFGAIVVVVASISMCVLLSFICPEVLPVMSKPKGKHMAAVSPKSIPKPSTKRMGIISGVNFFYRSNRQTVIKIGFPSKALVNTSTLFNSLDSSQPDTAQHILLQCLKKSIMNINGCNWMGPSSKKKRSTHHWMHSSHTSRHHSIEYFQFYCPIAIPEIRLLKK